MSARKSRPRDPRRRKLQLHLSLRMEALESRTLLAAGEWLAHFTGVPGDTRDVQLSYIQDEFQVAGLDAAGILADEHVGVDGTVIVQTDPAMPLEVVQKNLATIPGFASVEVWDDFAPSDSRQVYVPDSPFSEGEGNPPQDGNAGSGNTGGSDSGGVITPNVVQNVTGFNGINSTQTSQLSPPDTTGAVGPSSFIQTVNVSLAIYNKSTGATIPGGGITSFATFFSSLGSTESFSDPIIVYNDITQRFAIGILDFNSSITDSRMDFAISKTSNPTLSPSDWNMFRFNTNDGIGATVDFSDYPKIGYNADGFVVSFNMFPSSFDHVSVLGISNAGVGTGMRVMPGGFTNFTLAPASMHGAAPGAPMWFVGDGHTGGGGSTINLVRVDNPFSSSAVIASTFAMTVPTFTSTINPRQTGTGNIGSSASLGTRFYFSGLRTVAGVTHLVSAHAVGNGTGDSVRWYDYNVTAGTPTLIQTGLVNPNPATTDTYFPSIDIGPDGSLGMNYSESGTSEYMSMYVAGRKTSDTLGTMETPVLAHTNAALLNAFGRAGDYSFTTVDPVDGTFWATNEYASSGSSPNWATWIQHFTAGALGVVSSTPTSGAVLSTQPTSFTLTFSEAIDVSTLAPTDLSVNGIPADSVALSADNKTATFTYATSPVTTQGVQTMSMAVGAVTSLADSTLMSVTYSSTFRYDVVTLQVVSVSLASGGVFTLPGPFTYDVTFNEPISPSSVVAASLSLSGTSGAQVTGATVLGDGVTARFTLGGTLLEGTLAVQIPVGAVLDQYGNPGNAFSASYTTDVSVVPFTVPLTAKPPLGSLAYDPLQTGFIGTATDSDTFTISVNPGQTIAVLVTPTSTSLTPSVQILNSSNVVLGAATATSAGTNAMIKAVATTSPTPDVYRVVVSGSGGTTGTYSVQLVLNSEFETEGRLSGSTNNTLALAQAIDSSFTSPAGASSPIRISTVLGNTDTPATPFVVSSPTYAFENISTTGTAITFSSTDDGSTQISPAGFSFPFFGTSYSSVYVSTNGLISFGASDTAYTNTDLTTSPTEPVIAPFWDDLYVTGATTSKVVYQVVGTGSAAHLVIQWNNISFFDDSTKLGGLTFEAVLNLDGSVRFNYQSVSTGNNSSLDDLGLSATVGAKAAGTQGTNRTLVSYNAASSLVGNLKSVLLTPQIATSDYFSFNLNAGETISLGVVGATTTSAILNVDLVNSAGSVVASGVSGATNLTKALSNVAISAPGTYYARVNGTSATSYDLVITRNAAFDTEANDSFASAQNIGNNVGEIGYVKASTSTNAVISASELSLRTLNGVSLKGVTFGFTEAGVASTNAYFGDSWPAATQHMSGPVLDGVTTGTFTMTFAAPTPSLNFPIVVLATTSVADAATIKLYDEFNNLISTNVLATSVPSGFVYSEGFFSYTGSALVKQVVVTFNSTAAAAWATDNIAFTVPLVTDADWYSINTTGSGNHFVLSTSTPSDGTGQFQNVLSPHIDLYSPTGALVASGVVGPDGRNETISYYSTGPGAYRIRVTSKGSTAGEYLIAQQITAAPLGSVQSVVIDNGTAQRSMVRSITVTLNNNVVNAPSSAFSLVRTRDNLSVPVTASALVSLGGGLSRVTLTFSGPVLEFGSLSDGRYSLVINGAQMTDNVGRVVDANNTGLGGSAKTVAFHRFFGDANGDGLVDATDYLVFRAAYLSGAVNAANSIFDYNSDGSFSAADMQAFTNNMRKRTVL